jgi:hypothetical protein
MTVSTVIGPGAPSNSAGSNRYCLAAAIAAASKPSPTGATTVTSVTRPSASIAMRTVTSAVLPAASAAGG